VAYSYIFDKAKWGPEARYFVEGKNKLNDVKDFIESVKELIKWIEKYW
jgi:hypothetical protein